MFMQTLLRQQGRAFYCFSKRNASTTKKTKRIPRSANARDLFKELVLLPNNAPLKVVLYLGRKEPDHVAQLLKTDPRLWRFGDVWAPVLAAPDFDTLEQVFQSTEPKLAEPTSATRTWQPLTTILCHIVMNRAHTPEQLVKALQLVQYHLPALFTWSQSALITTTVAKLAELRLTAPLRSLVETFQSLPELRADHYNFLLRALTLAPGSKYISVLALELITALVQRGYTLQKQTCNDLLRPPFSSVDVALAIEARLREEDIKSDLRQLESFLHVMIRHGRRREASRFVSSLSPVSTDGPSSSPLSASKWEAKLVASFRNSAAASRHLQGLATTASAKSLKAGSSPRNSSSSSDWLSILRVAAKDTTFSPHSLLSTLRRGSAEFPVRRAAYEIALAGLLRKQSVDDALSLWDELRNAGLPLSSVSLGLGIQALTLAHRAHEAFELLEEAVDSYRSYKIRDGGQLFFEQVDLQVINQFMNALRQIGRPDVVFALWDHMGDLYGLLPDTYTLNIMLGTARWARKFDQSLGGVFRDALAELGFGKSQGSLPLTDCDSAEKRRAHLALHLSTMLDPYNRSVVTGQWGTEHASRVALRVAVRMLLGNWDHLKAIRSPVHATRKAPSDAALSPLSDAFHSFSRSSHDGEEHPSVLVSLLLEDPAPYPYPSIYPSDLTFRALLDLIASESLHAEIPLVLAWMRELKVRPSKTTIATALVHWIEVSMDAPLIERFKGGPNRSPYAALMAWLREWVGEENMPTRVEMSSEMARLAFFRHSRFDGRSKFVVTDPSGNVTRHRFWQRANGQ